MLRIWTVLFLGAFALGAIPSAASTEPQSQCDLKSIGASLAASHEVPSLRGCSPAEAQQLLGQFDYGFAIAKRVHSDEIPQGLIVRDRIQSGTVSVDVSIGPSDHQPPPIVTDIIKGLAQVGTAAPAAPPAAEPPAAEPTTPPLGDPANPFTHIIYPTTPAPPPAAQPTPTEPTPAPAVPPAQVAPPPQPPAPPDTGPPPTDTNDTPPPNHIAQSAPAPAAPAHADTSPPSPGPHAPTKTQQADVSPKDKPPVAAAPVEPKTVTNAAKAPIPPPTHLPWWLELLSKAPSSPALIWTLGTVLAGAALGLFLLPRASCSIGTGRPSLGSIPLRRRWPDLTVTTVIGAVSVTVAHPLPIGRRADAQPRPT